MNYKYKKKTPAYNTLAAYRWGGRKRKYPNGGMYGSNTVSSAGQGAGETSNIVYQESNPQVLEAKRNAMEAEKQRILNQTEMTQQEVAAAKEQTNAVASEAAANVGSKAEGIASTGKSIIETADQVSGGKLGEYAKQTGAKLFGSGKGAAPSLGVDKGYQIGDFARKSGQLKGLTLGTPSSGLSLSTPSSGLSLATPGSSNLSSSSSLFTTPAAPTVSSGITPPGGFSPNASLMGDKPLSLTSDLTNKGVSTLGSTVVKETAKKGLMSTTGVGASGVGTGLGKFASSGAGIGTIASLAGMGVTALSDDKDPTKLNFGEGAGATLSGIGTGIGAAALAGTVMGSAVPVIGNVIGAVAGAAYGLGKALVARKKARKAKAAHEAEIQAKKDKHNKKLTENLATQASIVRSGELEQKTYSGYDLGKNVNYRLGGKMQPLMKYA